MFAEPLKLIRKLFLVIVVFVSILFGLGARMGIIEISIWGVLLVAALALTVIRHRRRTRQFVHNNSR